MTASDFFLDVNIPMYAAGQDHPLKVSCARIMTEIANARLNVAIDTEIVQEILYRFGALRRWDIGTAMASNLLELVPVVYPIRLVEANLTIELFSQYAPQGIPARDLIHVAVMTLNDLTQIISTDAHFDLIAGITRLDPHTLAAAI
jgi:predicted nucleic acid-binding protein